MAAKNRTVKVILLIILAIILLLLCVILIRTFIYPFEKHEGKELTTGNIEVSDISIQRFAGGIRIPTISNQNYQETDFRPFERFRKYLEDSYPSIYENMETMVINDYSLVFRWKGEDQSRKPLLFLSHYDVVPVLNHEPDNDDDDEEYPVAVIFERDQKTPDQVSVIQTEWDHPPFSGAVTNGRIYGRGTLDMKGMLFSLLEAADKLISEGFVPQQDIWFAFGHDEEVGGLHGATKVAQYFNSQGIEFEAVYDEGGIITAPGTGGIDKSLALVGTTEKGFLSIRIKVRGIGGHSSMPPQKSSLVMASEIISKLNNEQMPSRLIPPISSFLDRTGSEMGFVPRMAIANKWLLGPVLLNSLSGNSATNALVRTTTAITMAKGSEAANVISSIAEVTVNFRLLPGDSVSTVLKHVQQICDGYDTDIEIINQREASNISPTDTPGFRAIEHALSQTYPGAILSPYVTIGGTDAYKYEIVSSNVYRFMPIYLNTYEQGTMHNENEHISIDNFGRMIEYFTQVMMYFNM